MAEAAGSGYDTHGTSLNDIKKRDEDQIKEAEMKKSLTSRMVTEAMREKRLEQKEFFIIEANVFCETPEGGILPAEISIVKFSLQEGVNKILHMFIKNVKIPFSFGYTYIVNDNLEETHKLELKDDLFLDYAPDALEKEMEYQSGKQFNNSQKKLIQEAEANRHYKSVCEEILKFLNMPVKDRGAGLTSRIKPTVFTMPGSMVRCEMSLEWLFNQAKFGNTPWQNVTPTHHSGHNPWTGYIPDWRILELPQLFHDLSNTSNVQQNSKVQKIPTISVAEHLLEKDSFKFADGMSCNWHRDYEKTEGCGGRRSDYCTSSAVRRWSYIMADHLCQQYGIKLKGGHHIPKQTDTDPLAQDDLDWEKLPGLAIFPKPTYHDLDGQHNSAQGGRSANTDIRYRNVEVKPMPADLPPDDDRVLHSNNIISDFMADKMSSSGRSVGDVGASVASEIADLADAQAWPSLGSAIGPRGRGRAAATPREGVFKQNAAMTTIMGNRENKKK